MFFFFFPFCHLAICQVKKFHEFINIRIIFTNRVLAVIIPKGRPMPPDKKLQLFLGETKLRFLSNLLLLESSNIGNMQTNEVLEL